MTKEELLAELSSLQDEYSGDAEAAHVNAESALMDFLVSNGMRDIAKAYRECRDNVGFWYA